MNLYMYTKRKDLQILLNADGPEYQHFKGYNPLLLSMYTCNLTAVRKMNGCEQIAIFPCSKAASFRHLIQVTPAACLAFYLILPTRKSPNLTNPLT